MDDQNKRAFDYVVVGAGAAASGLIYGILERRKCMVGKKPPFSVAVIERGGKDHDTRTHLPNKWHEASHSASASVSLLQTTIGSRLVDVPTGKGVGGTTNVNACLVAPPAREDFESWPEPWNREIMFAVREIQNELLRNGTVHQFRTTVKEMFAIDAADRSHNFWREANFPSLVTCIPMTVEKTKKGKYRRVNYYDALIAPVLAAYPHCAEGVTWFYHTEVQRIIFDGRHVIGVECESACGVVFQIQALVEVILSAGAFESPALLVASGVGLEDDLKEANIPSCGLDLPVGCNLRDHVLLPRLFIHPFTAYELSPSTVQAFYNIVDDERRFQVMLTGAATYPSLFAHVVASVIRRKVDLSPNWLTTLINILLDTAFRTIRVIVRNAVIYSPAFYFLRYFCFVANVALLNPKSCGRIRMIRILRRTDLRGHALDDYAPDGFIGELSWERDHQA